MFTAFSSILDLSSSSHRWSLVQINISFAVISCFKLVRRSVNSRVKILKALSVAAFDLVIDNTICTRRHRFGNLVIDNTICTRRHRFGNLVIDDTICARRHRFGILFIDNTICARRHRFGNLVIDNTICARRHRFGNLVIDNTICARIRSSIVELFRDIVKVSLVSDGTLLGSKRSKLTNLPLILSRMDAGIAANWCWQQPER